MATDPIQWINAEAGKLLASAGLILIVFIAEWIYTKHTEYKRHKEILTRFDRIDKALDTRQGRGVKHG